MKILQLPTYYYPETTSSSHLTEDLNEAYDKAGFVREVYVQVPCRGIPKNVREEYKKKIYRKEISKSGLLILHRFGMFPEGKNPIIRALRYSLICLKQFNRSVLCAKNVDLLFLPSTPPINGALGALIKKCKRIPFIYNLQDIFPDSLVSTGLASKNGILWKMGRMMENFTYRNADKIIVISQDFKTNIMAKGVPENKIEVIYNWINEAKVYPVHRDQNPLFDDFGLPRDKFYVVYAGNLGSAQNIEIILESAKGTLGNTDIIYIIFGREEQAVEYKQKVDEQNLHNVRFFPLQSLDRVSYVYSLGNVSVVSCRKGFGSIGMPSKLATIMSSGTAVLASFDSGSELQSIIEKNQVGVFTEAGDVSAFRKAVLYLSEHPDDCEKFGQNGRRFVLENLTKDVATKQYVDLIKSFEK